MRPKSKRHDASFWNSPGPAAGDGAKDSGDGKYRPPFPWKWVWIALALVLAGAGANYLWQRSAAFRDIDTLQAAVKDISGRYADVDRDFAARMADHRANAPFTRFGPEQAIDPGVRSATRAWVAAGIGIVDDALARRGKIEGDMIARIEASRASEIVKNAMLEKVRAAALRTPLPARIMQATRAYLEKIGEMTAFLDLNAQAIALREGQLEFDDSAAAERYDLMVNELELLERELQRLQQQTR